ncbi:hypothetical protein INR49_024494 [Caranx melampygus]|nr:hypothetical protein INR49_024494 [Caranx melampygus]
MMLYALNPPRKMSHSSTHSLPGHQLCICILQTSAPRKRRPLGPTIFRHNKEIARGVQSPWKVAVVISCVGDFDCYKIPSPFLSLQRALLPLGASSSVAACRNELHSQTVDAPQDSPYRDIMSTPVYQFMLPTQGSPKPCRPSDMGGHGLLAKPFPQTTTAYLISPFLR